MDFVNQTSVPAELLLGSHPEAPLDGRFGRLVAKATFEDLGRGLQLSDDPLPVLEAEVETPFGLLPRDTHHFREDRIEVVVLGAAYPAPGDSTQVVVAFEMEHERREIRVFGDRQWRVSESGEVTPGEPAPFTSMPLTWSRAYGGTVQARVDPATRIPIQHRVNPVGRGFGAIREMEHLAKGWGCSEGFPHDDSPSQPPNLEPTTAPLRERSEGTSPVCWATCPPELTLFGDRVAEAGQSIERAQDLAMELARAKGRAAHPSMCFPTPRTPTAMRLQNVTPDGEWQLTLPPLRLIGDAIVSRRSSLELAPRLLVLLPEERRVTVTYTADFRYRVVAGQERSVRLRTEVPGGV